MSAAENPESSAQETTDSPQEPELEQNVESGFGDYDTNIVQLSDTEEKGVPYDEIVDQYDEGDVDAFVYAGDASKKMADPASYLGRFEKTYEELSRIQEELDAEVLVEPGNHSPIKGSHDAGGWAGAADDEEYVEQVESILSEHYEDFSDFDGNAYEFLVDEYDLTNIEYGSVDIGDITVVGGTHHDAEMDKRIEEEWLEEDSELEDLDYDSEDLEEIADDLSGGFFSRIINKLSLGYFGTPNKNAEDVTLEEVPGDYKTEAHECYEEAIELKNYFEDAIESAENDVFLTHHGVASSFAEEFGSKVVDQVMEDYSEDIVGAGGGHTGTPGIKEHYGVPTINTNKGAVVELGYDEGDLVHSDALVEPETESQQQQPQISEEEAEAIRLMEMEEVGGPEEYWKYAEEQIEGMAEQAGIDDLEGFKQQRKERLEDIWDKKDEINPEEILEDSEALPQGASRKPQQASA